MGGFTRDNQGKLLLSCLPNMIENINEYCVVHFYLHFGASSMVNPTFLWEKSLQMCKNLRAYGNKLRAYGHILRAYGDQTPLITATSAPIETGHPP